MPCEILEEMRGPLEQYRGHEYQPLILMQIEAHQRGERTARRVTGVLFASFCVVGCRLG